MQVWLRVESLGVAMNAEGRVRPGGWRMPHAYLLQPRSVPTQLNVGAKVFHLRGLPPREAAVNEVAIALRDHQADLWGVEWFSRHMAKRRRDGVAESDLVIDLLTDTTPITLLDNKTLKVWELTVEALRRAAAERGIDERIRRTREEPKESETAAEYVGLPSFGVCVVAAIGTDATTPLVGGRIAERLDGITRFALSHPIRAPFRLNPDDLKLIRDELFSPTSIAYTEVETLFALAKPRLELLELRNLAAGIERDAQMNRRMVHEQHRALHAVFSNSALREDFTSALTWVAQRYMPVGPGAEPLSSCAARATGDPSDALVGAMAEAERNGLELLRASWPERTVDQEGLELPGRAREFPGQAA